MWPKVNIVDWGAHHRLATEFREELNDVEGTVGLTLLPQYLGNGLIFFKFFNFILWSSIVFFMMIYLALSRSHIIFYTPPEYGSKAVQSVQLWSTILLLKLAVRTTLCVRNIDNYTVGGCCHKLTMQNSSNTVYALETPYLAKRFSILFPNLQVSCLPVRCQPAGLSIVQKSTVAHRSNLNKITVFIPGKINKDHKQMDEIFCLCEVFQDQGITVSMLAPTDWEVLTFLSKFNNIEYAAEDEYLEFIRNSDVIILPLNKDKQYFSNKGSGGVYDGLALGKPVLAPMRYSGLVDEFVDLYYSSPAELACIGLQLNALYNSCLERHSHLTWRPEQIFEKISKIY